MTVGPLFIGQLQVLDGLRMGNRGGDSFSVREGRISSRYVVSPNRLVEPLSAGEQNIFPAEKNIFIPAIKLLNDPLRSYPIRKNALMRDPLSIVLKWIPKDCLEAE
ncbi:hypothetical protein ACTFIU_009048 [Dictyostelium citrinum]